MGIIEVYVKDGLGSGWCWGSAPYRAVERSLGLDTSRWA